MLRRLALVVALLGPAAALAQTNGQVLITPSTFGKADCTSTADTVTLSWTSTSTVVALDTYKIYVSTDPNCPTSGTPSNSTLLTGAAVDATTQTQTYAGTLTRQDFITDAGLSACSANGVIYVCVQHWATGASSAKGTATGSAKLEVLPPPIPVINSVTAGDSALFVDWSDGPSNGVTAASYHVTAVGSTGTVSKTSVGKSYRLDGLTNGVTYDVTVTSVSAGGNESNPSPVVKGTPQAVDDFWTQYANAGGREQGGCAGGAAGALSLLGVALALRLLRRRS